MPNLIELTYSQTGESTNTNNFGMRQMQERAFSSRASQYILLKAPPASGKSRALMYLALDKLKNQNIKKVIVAVPERSIGSSFRKTNLKASGFFADWDPTPEFNLCTAGGDKSKVKSFVNFMSADERILICTHATLRFAYEALAPEDFNNTLLAVDEFHHVSADVESRLGELIREVMDRSNAHIIAMTGSYFRGDSLPVLRPQDEQKFERVTYNYYEQLNGYEYLKSLGIGYHFYQGKYTSAINEILNTDKKTIIHIPNVQSGESTKDKHQEVDLILDSIGNVIGQDESTGVLKVRRHVDGRIIKVADLVNDQPREREKIVMFLRGVSNPEDIDLIIALGMAKEGFDWPFCEHALTVGYRGSLTEVVQIIGRCTRDSSNKSHAQFTNLIAQPDAGDDEVRIAVNNMLKAITCSLLMEQVLAPSFKFKTKVDDGDQPGDGEILVRGFKKPSTARLRSIIETDLIELKVAILQNEDMLKVLPGNVDPEVINKVMIPKIIREKYPELSEKEVEEIRQYVVIDSVVKSSEITESGDQRFIRMADKFVNIDDLHIDLIDSINPFQKAFEILSKSVTTKVLKVIQEAIESTRLQISDEEALLLWPKIKEFVKSVGREPDLNSADPLERRMAEAVIYLKRARREQGI